MLATEADSGPSVGLALTGHGGAIVASRADDMWARPRGIKSKKGGALCGDRTRVSWAGKQGANHWAAAAVVLREGLRFT